MVKKYPELIAGYNTMPQAQKEKFDIKGYSLLMKRSFIAVGLAIILFGTISKIIHWYNGFLLTMLILILILVVFLNSKAQRYK